MWRTPLGDRALKGAEWDLFRAALGMLWDQAEMAIESDEPDLFESGVSAFDRLTVNQKLAMLALVGHAAGSQDLPPPELTAITEGTVGAVFALLRQETAAELETADEPTGSRDPIETSMATYWRERVRAAYPVVAALEAADLAARIAEASPGRRSTETGQDAEPQQELPDATSDDADAWESMIESLADAMLWDTDFDADEWFLDLPPARKREKLDYLGVHEDYFLAVAPDPADKDLEEVRRALSEICGRE